MEAKFAGGHAIPFEINAASALGRGATADVYFVIVGDKRYAAKIYRSGTEFNAEKIASMCMMRDPSVQPSTTFAWPTALVYENGSIIGYLMPIFEKGDHHPLNYYFDATLISRLNDKSVASLSNRVEIAKYLCLGIAAIHARSTFFIDLKPQNILVNRITNAVVFLDCDGFSILTNYGRIIPAGHVSTDYIAPEVTRERLPPATLAEPQDNYALAVILFQMFNYSQHPFQGTPILESSRPFTNDELAAEGLYPHSLTPNVKIKPRRGSTHLFLPHDMRLLFDRSFIGDLNARVTPREWSLYFSRIINEKRLQRCNRFPNSVDHIHFKECGCPECAREDLKGQLTSATINQAIRRPPAPLVAPPSMTPTIPHKSSSTWAWILVACVAAFIFFIFTSANNGSIIKTNDAGTKIQQPVVTKNDVVIKKSALAIRKEIEALNEKRLAERKLAEKKLAEKKLAERKIDSSNSPRNPTNLSEVPKEMIINAKKEGKFQDGDSGGGINFNVVFTETIQISPLQNPSLFIANNACDPSKIEIAKAQEALASKGYRVGKIDGIMGPSTIFALKQFQHAKGLQLSGSLTKETALALGISVAGRDYTNFKFHSRGKVFHHASGTIFQFYNVNSGFKCFAVTR